MRTVPLPERNKNNPSVYSVGSILMAVKGEKIEFYLLLVYSIYSLEQHDKK